MAPVQELINALTHFNPDCNVAIDGNRTFFLTEYTGGLEGLTVCGIDTELTPAVTDYAVAESINEAMETFTKHSGELLDTFENFKCFETIEVFPKNNPNILEI
jgi:hypothetical protein